MAASRFYVQFGYEGRKLKAIALTQKKPYPTTGRVAVKMEVTIPDEVFQELVLEAVVDIPVAHMHGKAAGTSLP